MTDEERVALAQGGDSAAMNALLETHYERLYAICRRIAGNDADAADACQEALLAVVKGIGRFDNRSSFKTWSHRVATNACLDELRRRKRRPIAVVDEPDRISDEPDVAQRVSDRLTIDEALPQIPEEFRAPVVLRDVIGMDYAEIAETLELAPGTVRSRIARGRRHLANVLAPDIPDGPDSQESSLIGEPDALGERQRPPT